MKVRLRSVSQVLIGLDRIGLLGLDEAFKRADEPGLGGRDELISFLMDDLSRRNFIPPPSENEYRKAVWREYLRHRGEDIRHLYSEIEVVVGAEAGEERDRIVGAVKAVLNEHELEPSFRYESPGLEGASPTISIAGQVVLRGARSESALRKAIKARMDDW